MWTKLNQAESLLMLMETKGPETLEAIDDDVINLLSFVHDGRH